MHDPPASDRSARFGVKTTDRPARFSRTHAWLAGLTLAASIASLFAEYHWLADILANLRVQQLIGLAFLVPWSLLLRRWRWSIALAACVATHLPWFLVDHAPQPTAGAPTRSASLTVTSANVLIGNPQLDDVEAAILAPQADVVAILELDPLLQTHLAARMQREYPHRHELPREEDGFGIGLYAKVPLEDLRVVPLDDIYHAIAARVEVRGQRYRIIAVHTLPPIGSLASDLRNRHLQLIAEMSRVFQEQEPDCPLILMGDLNVTPWSPHFRTLERAAGVRRASQGAFLTPTWHALPGFPFGLALDHVLVSDALRCSRLTVGPSMGSDHRTVTAELHGVR